MRGLPGSGKSTVAHRIKAKLDGVCGVAAVILSTDDRFMVNGEYKFDHERIGEAHAKTLSLARELMEGPATDRAPCVIIDNTNVKHEYMESYKKLARKFRYRIVEKSVGCRCQILLEEYARRNSHGVPLEIIERMAKEWEE